jgi:hypothetical protein
MTDAEILCQFMEPKPPECDLRTFERLWWTVEGGARWSPRNLTLDAIWEIEERLTKEQWGRYQMLFPHRRRETLHADAPTRIRALAAVLRPVVEAGVQQ